MRVGLGVTSYNRPDYLAQCLAGIEKHLLDVVDSVCIYNDGSDKGKPEYKRIYKNLPAKIKYKHNPINHGVAHAKNYLLKRMYDEGCDYIFILEDDIVPQSPKAITEYIRLSKVSGIEHFSFAHHGTMNEGMLYKSTKGIDLYTACIGAYGMYTPKVLEQAGYMDPNFRNAYEHVEHTYRIQQAGLTTPYPTYPDLTRSREYLKEIPGSITNSSIRVREEWGRNIVDALLYWQSKDRDFPLKQTLQKLTKELEVIAV